MSESTSRLHKKNQHLLWRAGFGPSAGEPGQFEHASPEKLFRHMLKASEKAPTAFDVASLAARDFLSPASPGREVMTGTTAMTDTASRNAAVADGRRAFRKQSALDIRNLSLRWLDEMVASPAQLREKMALFWHGHFASRTGNIIFDQQLLQVIRENALGSFRDLLPAVARTGSLTQFLNNNQNRKNHPNENFARELMELFTLGRGRYTESDVKESARAFTGWGVDITGNFQFRDRQHDTQIKNFLGRSGNWNGDDILQIILEQPQCARFISEKIYRFFVNETVPPERLTELAKRFFDSGYSISGLLTDIYTSDWFYDEENTAIRIKSPVEWMVGMRRQLPMEWEDPQVQLLMQRLLGQVLFNPPNVAGWPGGRHWIDSSSLMLRLRFPQLIDEGAAVNIKPKNDDDTEMGMKTTLPDKPRLPANGKGRGMHSRIDWARFAKLVDRDKEEDLYQSLSAYLLQLPPTLTLAELRPYLQNGSRRELIRSMTLRLMESPEYQLC